jgi:acylphosphatase
MVQKHLIISGKVVGVFFRVSMKQKADSLNVTGWVKNVNNHVEALIEGDERDVEKLYEWCKKGSSSAKVESIEEVEIFNKEISKKNDLGKFRDFRIIY